MDSATRCDRGEGGFRLGVRMTLTRRTGQKIFIGEYTFEVVSIGARFARIRIVKTKEPEAFSITSTADSGDTWQFGGMLIGISEIRPLKKVMVSVHAPHEIAILRSELVGRTPTSANPVLREAMRGMMKGISSNRPGIH